jgi:hypothetical protein
VPTGFFIKENMMFKNFTANWKTTVAALIPLLAYGLKYAGIWPESMPLPPFDEVWPFVLGLIGVGVAAKDQNVTNSSHPTDPSKL